MIRKLFLFVMPAILFACKDAPLQKDEVKYETMTVSEGTRTLLSSYSARVSGSQVVEVRPQVSGLITRICIKEGERVRKGQVLFIIDQVPYQAALKEAVANVKSAQAALETAQLEFNSKQYLREQGVVQDYDLSVARNAYAQAQAALMQAQAQEENARNSLSYTEVKSPVDGVAGMIPYRVGALVSSSIDEPLVTVASVDEVYAYFSMTESQVIDIIEQYGSLESFIKASPEVSLQMSNGETYEHTGKISAVSGIVSSSTNAVTLRADFPNPKGLLREGGSAAVIVPTELQNCIVIPQSATFELQDKVFVYKVVDGRAESVLVKVHRLNNGEEYIVESGLSVGETIISEGAGLINEGAEVK